MFRRKASSGLEWYPSYSKWWGNEANEKIDAESKESVRGEQTFYSQHLFFHFTLYRLITQRGLILCSTKVELLFNRNKTDIE